MRVADREIQFCLDVATDSLKFFEVKQPVIQQMGWDRIAERGQHRAANVWNVFFQFSYQTLDARALEFWLRAAKVAGDDRKLLRLRKLSDVCFAAISKRTNNRITPIVRTKYRRH